MESIGAIFDTFRRPKGLRLSDPGLELDLDQLERYRCAAFLETTSTGPDAEYFLWTSLHCWQPLTAAGMVLWLYDPASGEYSPASFDSPSMDFLKEVREAFSNPERVEESERAAEMLDDTVAEMRKRFDDLTKEVTQECIAAEVHTRTLKGASADDFQAFCFNPADAIRVPIVFKSPEQKFQDVLHKLQVEQSNARDLVSTYSFLSGEDIAWTTTYPQDFSALSTAYLQIMATPIYERVVQEGVPCTEDDRRSACVLQALASDQLSIALTDLDSANGHRSEALRVLTSYRFFIPELMFGNLGADGSISPGSLQNFMQISVNIASTSTHLQETLKIEQGTLGAAGLQSLRRVSLSPASLLGRSVTESDALLDLKKPYEVLIIPRAPQLLHTRAETVALGCCSMGFSRLAT